MLKYRHNTIFFYTMKFLKFLKGSIVALAVVAITGFSQEAQAQYAMNPVTVDITPQDFQAAHAMGVIPVRQLNLAQYVSNGPGGGVAPWPPIVNEPPCPDAEGMTPALAAYLLGIANQRCRPVYYCVQEEDCGWYMYVFMPNDPRCQFAVQYQSVLQAYSQ